MNTGEHARQTGESAASRRLARVAGQLLVPAATKASSSSSGGKGKDTLTVTDNRTGKTIDVVVRHNTVDAKKFMQLQVDKAPLRLYDPGLKNTASCTSAISFIDGEGGRLLYRGYPIEQLAEQSTFLETSYLLVYGELPSADQLRYYTNRVMRHTFVHEDLKQLLRSFRWDAHPMGMLISALSAYGTLHSEANPALAGTSVYDSQDMRNKQLHRMLGMMPTLAAICYRHRVGRAYVDPCTKDVFEPADYAGNFLYMIDKLSNPAYAPNPKLVRALDVCFILHAEHGLNASTAAVRHLSSTGVDLASCIAGGTAALYGPAHGGANEAVVRMLTKIGTKENVHAFVQDVKSRKLRVSGLGHRVYKTTDPRARVIKKLAMEVFEITGRVGIIDIALELEKVCASDPYFTSRGLYPNVDFYTGCVYTSLGFTPDYFPLLFAVPRTAGWLAHWHEFLDDPERVIVRPRQRYVGSDRREYVPVASRPSGAVDKKLVSPSSAESRRRAAAGMAP